MRLEKTRNLRQPEPRILWSVAANGSKKLSDRTDGEYPVEDVKNETEQNAASEDPAGVFKRDFGFNLAGPFVVGKQVDGSESVGGKDCHCNNCHYPYPDIGYCVPGRSRLEVGKVDVGPFRGRLRRASLAFAAAAHVEVL